MALKDGGRVALRCPSCLMTVAYLSSAKVRQGADMAGFKLMPASSALSSVANAAALRCVTCEGIAIGAVALAHNQGSLL